MNVKVVICVRFHHKIHKSISEKEPNDCISLRIGIIYGFFLIWLCSCYSYNYLWRFTINWVPVETSVEMTFFLWSQIVVSCLWPWKLRMRLSRIYKKNHSVHRDHIIFRIFLTQSTWNGHLWHMLCLFLFCVCLLACFIKRPR